MSRKDFIKDLTLCSQELARRDLSVYQLAKLTGIKLSTMYAYFNGINHIPDYACYCIADALEKPVTDLFPQLPAVDPGYIDLREKLVAGDPGYEIDEILPRPHRRVSDEDIKHYRRETLITANDMVVGSATLAPGKTMRAKVRMIRRQNSEEHESYEIAPRERVLARTGIKAKSVNLGRTLFRADKKLALYKEMSLEPLGYDYDGELSLVVRAGGKALLLARGVEFADILLL